MGTTTIVYLWSTLAAALPNGIFLEITASSVTRLHVFIFVVDGECLWTIVIKLCVGVFFVFFKCVCGGILNRGAQKTCSVVTWGWLKHDWMAAGTLSGKLWWQKGRGRVQMWGQAFSTLLLLLLATLAHVEYVQTDWCNGYLHTDSTRQRDITGLDWLEIHKLLYVSHAVYKDTRALINWLISSIYWL